MEDKETAPLPYDELIRKMCPYYMAMGMSYEEYWDGDADAPKYYSQARKLINKKRNEELWIQGMYIYEALIDVSPLLRAFTEKPKAHPYPTEPYPLTEIDRKEAELRKEKAEMEQMRAYMINKGALEQK